MLNHEDWFKAKDDAVGVETRLSGNIPLELIGDPDPSEDSPATPEWRPTNKLAIVERLRKDHGVIGHVDAEKGGFENTSAEELAIHFKRAGVQCDAFVNRETGEIRVGGDALLDERRHAVLDASRSVFSFCLHRLLVSWDW